MNLEFLLQDDPRKNAKLDCAKVQITSIQWKISNQPETGPILFIWSFKEPKQTEARGVHLNEFIF